MGEKERLSQLFRDEDNVESVVNTSSSDQTVTEKKDNSTFFDAPLYVCLRMRVFVSLFISLRWVVLFYLLQFFLNADFSHAYILAAHSTKFRCLSFSFYIYSEQIAKGSWAQEESSESLRPWNRPFVCVK